MPRHIEPHPISPGERRREVVAILAKGVLQWHRKGRAEGLRSTPKSLPLTENGLEFSGETRLSVSDGTRGFTPRGDGDDA